MTDSPDNLPDLPAPLPRAVPIRYRDRKITHLQRVQNLLDALAYGTTNPDTGEPTGPLNITDAARLSGLRVKRARALITHPEIRAEYLRRVHALREAEAARNLHRALDIRDDERLSASPAGRKVQLEAVKYLDGSGEASTRGAGGVSVSVSVAVPGYVIDLSGDKQGPRLIDSQHAEDVKPLD